MKRWDNNTKSYIEDVKIDEFLNEINEVCKKHGFSISHEDGHGAFEIEKFDENEFHINWLMNAHRGYSIDKMEKVPNVYRAQQRGLLNDKGINDTQKAAIRKMLGEKDYNDLIKDIEALTYEDALSIIKSYNMEESMIEFVKKFLGDNKDEN